MTFGDRLLDLERFGTGSAVSIHDIIGGRRIGHSGRKGTIAIIGHSHESSDGTGSSPAVTEAGSFRDEIFIGITGIGEAVSNRTEGSFRSTAERDGSTAGSRHGSTGSDSGKREGGRFAGRPGLTFGDRLLDLERFGTGSAVSIHDIIGGRRIGHSGRKGTIAIIGHSHESSDGTGSSPAVTEA